MKILLVNEAAGVHRYLRDGLRRLGHSADLLVIAEKPQGRQADIILANTSIVGSLKIHAGLPFKLDRFQSYDLVNYILSPTMLRGFFRYADLRYFRAHGIPISYYGVGCDEISMPRVRADRNDLPFCTRCEVGDRLGRYCVKKNGPRRARAGRYANLIDFAIASAAHYAHLFDFLPQAHQSRIAFPVNVLAVGNVGVSGSPVPTIMHAPTRRAFKGTAQVLEAVSRLRETRGLRFHFHLVEGVSHRRYLDELRRCDIFIDQLDVPAPGIAALEAMAMGKVVISGNMEGYAGFFPHGDYSPVIHGSSETLSETLAGILRKPYLFRDMGQSNRDYVESVHDHIRIAQQFLDLWQSGFARGTGTRFPDTKP